MTDTALTLDIAQPPARWGRAALAALVIEVAVMTGAAWLMDQPPPPPPPRPEITLDLTTLPPKPPEPVPPKVEPKPEPQKIIEKPTPKREIRKPAPTPQPQPKTVPPLPGPVSNAPSAFAEPPPPPVAPAPPPPPSHEVAPAVEELLKSQMQAAVQAEWRYPNAAKILKLSGECRLTFDYRDGRVTNARIAESAGHSALDAAALEALAAAKMPLPPPEMAGHTYNTIITIYFTFH
jgi:protein TonB